MAAPGPKVKVDSEKKVDPEKAYADAVKLFNEGRYQEALKGALAAFDMSRPNMKEDDPQLVLVVNCFLRLGQRGKAQEWLIKNEPNKAVVDWVIHHQEKWLETNQKIESIFPEPRA